MIDDSMPEPEYTASVEGSLAIIRAYNDLTFLDRMRPLMQEVAKELVRAGFDFSKVRQSNI